MTRETKIGLLVGLAFIIVLGILIADYTVNSMQPPAAPLVNAGPGVIESNNALGTRRAAPLPQRDGDVRVPLAHPVDLEVPRRVVNPSGNNGDGLIRITQAGMGNPRNLIINDNPPFPFDNGNDGGLGTRRDAEVAQNVNNEPAHDEVERPLTMSALREYKAEPGDTVYGMARKFLGSGSKENRDAIVNVNPALKANPDRIQAGTVYKIPAREDAPRGAGNATNSVNNTPIAPPTLSEETFTYTTRPGDSLWKIATTQCGSGSQATVNRIRELNKDIIKGDAIKPNMTLKLPKKGN